MAFSNKKKYPVSIYNLSKNQLLQLINDIYKNKFLFDKKCKENKLLIYAYIPILKEKRNKVWEVSRN